MITLRLPVRCRWLCGPLSIWRAGALWGLAVSIGLSGGYLLAALAVGTRVFMGLGPVGFQLLNSVLFAIPWIVGTRFRRRFDRRRDRVARAEGRICLDCGFDLRGLETSGNCPECGAEFDAGRNRSLCSRGGF